MRPDPAVQPGTFAKWRQLVSLPATVVSPILAAREDSFNDYTSTTWSGFVATTGTRDKYDIVEGEWGVPTANPSTCCPATASSWWVGLDKKTGIIQAGTRQSGYWHYVGGGRPGWWFA